MEYYLISLVITIFIFGIIQIYEYNKNKREIDENVNNFYIEPYSLFSMNNMLLLVILYIVFTIGAYYLNVSKWKFTEFKKAIIGGDMYGINKDLNGMSKDISNDMNGMMKEIKEDIDPKILSKINDNFNVGFEPFTSDLDDASSMSSLSSAD
jgi:hypothetical protein